MNDRKPTKFDAILELIEDGVLARKGEVLYNEDHELPKGKKIGDVKSEEKFTFSDTQKPPSETAITEKLNSLISNWEASQFQRDRQYPELGEQLDMLFHDMTAGKGDKTGEWYKAIVKVKTDNPKPTE